MAYIVRFMNPFKSLNFLRDYFEAIRVIQAHKTVQLLTQDCDFDEDEKLFQTVTSRLRLANIFIILKLFHFAFLLIISNPEDPIVSILNMDVVRMCHMDNALQIQGFLFYTSIHFYYGRMLFVKFHPFFLTIYNDFLFRSKLDHIFLTPLVYRGVSIEKQIKRNVLKNSQKLNIKFD